MLKSDAALLPIAIASAVLGVVTVLYVDWVGFSPVRIAALPLLLVLLAMLVMDKRRLFLGILLVRAVCDPIFDSAKFSIAGMNLGVGAVLNALVILMALLFICERVPVRQSNSAQAARPGLPLWVPALLLILLAAVLRSPEPGAALRTFLVLLSYAAVFVIPFHLARQGDDANFCFRIVLLSSLLPVLYALADLLLHIGPGFRLQGSFTHPNIFAFYLLLVLALLFHQLKSETVRLSPLLRGWACAYMALLLILLVLTQTRSAWLAGSFVFAVYGLLFERRLLLYLLVVPVFALGLPEVRERLLDLTATNYFDPYAQLNSFDWRIEIWKAGLVWMQPLQLLVGYGLNAFAFYSPQFFALAGHTHHGAHNVYVQWFFETGAIGLLCLLWLFQRLLHTLGRRYASDRRGTSILMAMVVAYLLVCASDNMIDYLSFNWYFWFALGAACCAAVQVRRPA